MGIQDWGLITAASDETQDWGLITESATTTFDWGDLTFVFWLNPTKYDNSQTFYGPTVATSNVLSPEIVSNSQIFYVFETTVGSVSVAPERYNNTHTFNQAQIALGAVVVAPEKVQNDQDFYEPIATVGPVNLAPELLENTNSIYFPNAITGQTQEITFPDWPQWLYFGENQFFAPQIAKKAAITGGKPKRKRGQEYSLAWEPGTLVFDDRAAARAKRKRRDILLMMV